MFQSLVKKYSQMKVMWIFVQYSALWKGCVTFGQVLKEVVLTSVKICHCARMAIFGSNDFAIPFVDQEENRPQSQWPQGQFS